MTLSTTEDSEDAEVQTSLALGVLSVLCGGELFCG
jgi:hypothetical protein